MNRKKKKKNWWHTYIASYFLTGLYDYATHVTSFVHLYEFAIFFKLALLCQIHRYYSLFNPFNFFLVLIDTDASLNGKDKHSEITNTDNNLSDA